MKSESTSSQIWLVGATEGIGAGLRPRLEEQHTVHAFARATGHDFGDEATAPRLLEEFGVPWAWVHTPGAFFEKPLLETTSRDWDLLLASNLLSFLTSARSVLPAMAANGGGRVVAFGVAGLSVANAKTKGPAYFAVKAALLSCVRTLAREFAPQGVCVNMVSPGAIAHDTSHRESQERVRKRIPRGRLGTPQDLAGLVDFLVSSDAAYVTGQEISVDGGLALGIPQL